LLLLLLEEHLLLVELLNSGGVDVLIEVRSIVLRVLGGLLDPEVLGRFEIIAEDRDDLLDLIVAVGIDEEVERLVEERALRGARVLPLHGLHEVLVLLQGLLQDLLI
jgi:hypothetical protein